ncbi:HAD family hydrolase [Kutzneria viridogrisea]|uniref:HAD superfamily hydrolase (TIGR01549 family) n=1 Tax=Kutzneria viridogrisea TaxID=47990 RepID=A0ABR6BRQ3_9PSEU|nr:HAD superfamily hydrolase (TIGR01549 family) [Kutzneria viridogrisea]
MTDVPVDDPETLRRILANTEALLLDFDGPICSVFAGFPAHVVADQLRDVLAQGGHRDLPADIAKSADPFDVLKYAATLGEDEARYVEAAFRAHELEAVNSAHATNGAHNAILKWKSTTRPLAIVSNNSTASIEAYLAKHKMQGAVDYISARVNASVEQLKPDPHLIHAALNSLSKQQARATLIGDSATDIYAARAAHVISIGYANRIEKISNLAGCGATVVITSMNLINYIE